MKILTTIIILALIFSTIPPAYAAEIGIKIPFGPGEKPQNNSAIEKLKNEKTQGAWTGIGLIILAAAIVAATILIVNEVDEVAGDAKEEIDETQEAISDIKVEIKETIPEQ